MPQTGLIFPQPDILMQMSEIPMPVIYLFLHLIRIQIQSVRLIIRRRQFHGLSRRRMRDNVVYLITMLFQLIPALRP